MPATMRQRIDAFSFDEIYNINRSIDSRKQQGEFDPDEKIDEGTMRQWADLIAEELDFRQRTTRFEYSMKLRPDRFVELKNTYFSLLPDNDPDWGRIVTQAGLDIASCFRYEIDHNSFVSYTRFEVNRAGLITLT